MIMNNAFKYIITKAASVSAALFFGFIAFAQEGQVMYDKKVTPDPDPNGVYTISLEAFVTGRITVTTETLPADILLVLDYSQSMDNDVNGTSTNRPQNQRINILRSSVKDFVDIIKTSNESIPANDKDTYGGHRIAFIIYNSQIRRNTGFINAENLTTTAASGSGSNYTPAEVRNGNTNLIGNSTAIGTYSGDAMEAAESVLNGVNYSNTNRTRVVVFFTDGAPGNAATETNWQNTADRLAEANQCITAANTIKNSTTHKATVYSVGMFPPKTNPDATTTFLSYTSSDFETGPQMTRNAPSGGWVQVSGDKSIIVSSANALSQVFSTIASSAGGDYSASSASSVMIDVVASSFSIPTSADLGSVKVYKVKCTVPSADAGQITFDDAHPEDITDQVSLTTPQSEGGVENEVQVTGFDYGAEWCGWDESHENEDGSKGAPHGHKLVLTIPITVNDDAVGGPHVNTNTTDSKLIIKDKDGNVVSENVFPRPYLKLPVSLWIQKDGLLEDDSAVFNLRRTPYHGPDVDYSASTIVWEEWGEKVTCNKSTMNEDGIVKVSGLSPDYVYKIYEDAWGRLGYIYEDDDAQYSVGDNVENPFVFRNTPKKVVFDEATVRNVFKKKEKTSSTTTE